MKRNLVCEVHSYTGEVRWMPPEQVGVVMEGTRSLPVETRVAGTTNMQPAQVSSYYPGHALPTAQQQQGNWIPHYPQVVMLSSGLMQVQQPAMPGWSPQPCSYNCFPVVWNFGSGVIARGEGRSELVQSTLEHSPGRRILPPTWETSVHSCSPFLPPYPVAVLAESTDRHARASSDGAVEEKTPAARVDQAERTVAATTKIPVSRTAPVNCCAQSTPITPGHHLPGCKAQWTGAVMSCWMPVHPTRQLSMQYIHPGLRLSESRKSLLMCSSVFNQSSRSRKRPLPTKTCAEEGAQSKRIHASAEPQATPRAR